MKDIFIFISLMMVFISSPLAANQDKTASSDAAEKQQEGQIDVYLEKYGVRQISENGRQKSLGLYKIIIGDPLKLQSAMNLNRLHGFHGLIFTTDQDKKNEWHKIIVHRSVGAKRGWKKSRVVKKAMLPIPFNTMADDLLNKIHFFNIYPDNDGVAVVYIIEGTQFSDCEKIFNYIRNSRNQPQKSAGL